MKKLIRYLVIAVTALTLTSTATATVLTFEDTPQDTALPLEKVYGGLSWSNMYTLNPSSYNYSQSQGTGYVNGVISGGSVAFNGHGWMAEVRNSTPFDFNGAWFTSAWTEDNTLYISGYRDAVLIYDIAATLNNLVPFWVEANFLDIDLLRLSTDNWEFAMDNFTYNEVSAVPEPSAILLFATGVAALLVLRVNKAKR